MPRLLPFPSRSFDAVTTCHVMHLVGPWREALREYGRLLKPSGVYINARTDHTEDRENGEKNPGLLGDPVSAHGASSKRPGIQNPEELHTELRKIGASLKKMKSHPRNVPTRCVTLSKTSTNASIRIPG